MRPASCLHFTELTAHRCAVPIVCSGSVAPVYFPFHFSCVCASLGLKITRSSFYKEKRQVYSRRRARRRSLRRAYSRATDPTDCLADLLDVEAARVEVLSVHTLHRKQRPGAVHVEHGRRERPLVVSRLPSCWLSAQTEWSLCSELNRSVCSTSHHSVGVRAQIIRSVLTFKFARFAMLHEQAPHHRIARTT